MTTFTIELDDVLAQQLEQRAQKSQITANQMAEIGLRSFLQSTYETASDAEFETVAKRAVARDAELLQRLAK